MSRYVIKFYKEGTIRYISHLDILRLFKRSFKRVNVRLQYSQGFNPHPKMSFAQPLSLGYFSSSEYLEFDTTNSYLTSDIKEKLNTILPEGIHILSCEELPVGGKTLAALTKAADYEIALPVMGFRRDIHGLVTKYMAQDQILIQKRQKKSGKDLEVDIKPMILELTGSVNDNNIMITTKLSAGSTANLSPEMILSTFCSFAEIPYDRAEVRIQRTEIYFDD